VWQTANCLSGGQNLFRVEFFQTNLFFLFLLALLFPWLLAAFIAKPSAVGAQA
jgi:hypothetical protein